ncbi:MAG: glutamate--cysteine ligase [Cardiobacteriaceae bacterium]|nr:glutamate--cysteine ligase [Cardiobacteriaceae bacterium]
MHYTTLPLKGGRIGIERETLRVTADGHLARTPHPQSLGNTFTHPRITIDYGEALLEFVTSAHDSAAAAHAELLDLTRYTAQRIGNEHLWPASMPCILPERDEDIALGYFGDSNAGKIKRLYREGLSHRYGRPMQMIAGIHYNYSPPAELFDHLAAADGRLNDITYRNERYMGMLRSLQRHSWLICYLYGASPAVHDTFCPGRGLLHPFGHDTLGWHYATTLRMSQLGYQNKTDFTVSFNDLDTYIRDLIAAVMTPAPAFEYLGRKNPDGSHKQISTHILQIANEYYTAARPKQPVKRGEHPEIALSERGIAYVELRLMDINPYDPAGISLAQMHILETLLLWTLLHPAPVFAHHDWNELNSNRIRAACCGLTPDIELTDHGTPRPAKQWAEDILRAMQPIAQTLGHTHAQHLADLLDALANGQVPLAHHVQRDAKAQGHIAWAQALIQAHQSTLLTPLEAQTVAQLDAQRDQSLAQYAALEAAARHDIPFNEYLAHYFDPLKHWRTQHPEPRSGA